MSVSLNNDNRAHGQATKTDERAPRESDTDGTNEEDHEALAKLVAIVADVDFEPVLRVTLDMLDF